MKPRVKPSDIVFHGRTLQGFSVFTCYSLGLGSFRTDEEDEDTAKADALAYFNREAQK